MRSIDGYVTGVLSGEIPTCEWVRLACERHDRDRKQSDFAYRFDDELAALESAATQLSAVSARAATNAVLAHDDPTIVDIQGQLDRLADAQRELDALDTASGLAPATSPLFSSPTSTSP